MPTIRPNKPNKSGSSKKNRKGDDAAASRNPLKLAGSRAMRQPAVLMILVVIAAAAIGGQAIWQRVAPSIFGRERYLLRADGITTTPPPKWIVADVREQVIKSAGLDGRLSILDPKFANEIKSAFALHPWIASVEKVEKSYPPAVAVTLTYRQPVAVVEAPQGESVQLLPVDAAGIHLPAEDVPLIHRQYLPRIMNIVGQPPAGQRWDDPRVSGGVELAVLLADVWEALHLVEIVPSARAEVHGDKQFFVYELVTKGGTHIQWGAAPHTAAPEEATFAVKLDRLQKCVREYGPLNEVTAPGTVNVRGELEVKPRMVKKPDAAEPESVVK